MDDPSKQIVKDIVQADYDGEVKAIGCVLVDQQGHIRVLFGYGHETRFPLVAGAAMLQKNILDFIEQNPGPNGPDGRRS